MKRSERIFNIAFSLLAIALVMLCDSCLIVKQKTLEEEIPLNINQSLKPEIPMSETTVLSRKGDMIAFLPKDWFFVDITDQAPADIIAMAVNPDYTLGAVFSALKKSEQTDEVYEKEGLNGLARLCYEKHQKKSAGSMRQVGKYSSLLNGNLSYAKFEFTNAGPAMTIQAAVFRSEIGLYYEFSLVPLNLSGKPLPDKSDRERTFQSILSMIQY